MSIGEFDSDDPDTKQRIAELARSDRDSAPIYSAYFEDEYGETPPRDP